MALKRIDTLLVKRKTGIDSFSKDTHDDEELELDARFNNETQIVKDEKGIEFLSMATIYYDQNIVLNIGDLVKVKDTSDDFRPIKAISNYRNGSGTKFLNVAYLNEKSK
jgi:hypothetical protein